MIVPTPATNRQFITDPSVASHESRVEGAHRFFQAVVPDLADGEVCKLFWLQGKIHHNYEDLRLMARDAVGASGSKDLYFTVFTFPQSGTDREGKHALRAQVVWADLDYGPSKKHSNSEEALAKLESFALRPHIIVGTGHGFHVYWLLNRPTADKERLKGVVKRVARALDGDAVQDAARVLRVPGTWNRKEPNNALPVTLLRLELDRGRFDLEEFESILPSEVPLAPARGDTGKVEVERHNLLKHHVGVLRRVGAYGGDELREMLMTLNQSRCSPPLPQDEVEALARWGAGVEGGLDGEGSLHPAPPYPVEALPESVRQFVVEGAAALQVPPERIAVPLLAAAGSTLGRNVEIRLKQGWSERPILWVADVGETGSGKSPAQSYATKGLKALQSRAATEYERQIRDYEALNERNRKEKREAAKSERPAMCHFYTTDATPEAIAPMLRFSPGVAYLNDELLGFVRGFDSYKGSGKGKERQHWLTLWSGSQLKVDRKTGEPILVNEPVVGIIGGVQPNLLKELAGQSARSDDDGFLARFLFSYPEAMRRGWSDEDISAGAVRALENLFEGLTRIRGSYSLSKEAKGLWVDWYERNEGIGSSASGPARGMTAKLPAQLARIALVLHCLGSGSPASEIADPTVRAAIAVVEYHRAHAYRVFAKLGATAGLSTVAEPPTLKERIAEFILSFSPVQAVKDPPSSIPWAPRSDILRAFQHHPATEIDAALADPVFCSRTVRGGRGRPPTEYTMSVLLARTEGKKERMKEVEAEWCPDCGQATDALARCPDCDGQAAIGLEASGRPVNPLAPSPTRNTLAAQGLSLNLAGATPRTTHSQQWPCPGGCEKLVPEGQKCADCAGAAVRDYALARGR